MSNMTYFRFATFHFCLYEIYSFRNFSICLTWSTSHSWDFILVYRGIFISAHFICLTWSTSHSVHFILAYTKYFHLDPFHLSYMKYFSFRPFHFSLHEVFSFRAISYVLHEVLPTRAISFFLTWSIFISSNVICVTWSTSNFFIFIFSSNEVFLLRAISLFLRELLPSQAS